MSKQKCLAWPLGVQVMSGGIFHLTSTIFLSSGVYWTISLYLS